MTGWFGACGVVSGAVYGGTQGCVLYVNSSGNLASTDTDLFWDASNKRLGIGTGSPDTDLEIAKTTPELRLTNSGDGAYSRISRASTNVAKRYNQINQPGGVGNGVLFDGASEFANGTDIQLADTKSLTVSVWIKWAAIANAKAILGKWDYQTQGSWQLQSIDGDELIAYIAATANDNGSRIAYTTDLNMVNGTWYHVVLIFDGTQAVNSNRTKMYINGAQKTLGFSGIIAADIVNSSATLKMAIFNGLGRNANVELDEVAVWNRVLTANDVTDLYNSGSGLFIVPANNFPTSGTSQGTNLKVLYHLDEISGTNCDDSSGNNQDATLTNMAGNEWTLGVVSSEAVIAEAEIWKSQDGTGSLEKGILTFGEAAGRTIIRGTSIRIVNNIAETETIQITTDGDLVFTLSGGGLGYGSCYGNDIAWAQLAAVQNTVYLVSDADMLDGQLNLVSHDGSGKLTVTYAGRYYATWSGTVELSVANQHVYIGLAVAGAATDPGKQQVEAKFANEEEVFVGTAILSLTAGQTVEVFVKVPDAGTPNILVDHLNLSLVMIGG